MLFGLFFPLAIRQNKIRVQFFSFIEQDSRELGGAPATWPRQVRPLPYATATVYLDFSFVFKRLYFNKFLMPL